MDTIGSLLRNFFTHKEFLSPPEQLPGTLFIPLKIIWCAMVFTAVTMLLSATTASGM